MLRIHFFSIGLLSVGALSGCAGFFPTVGPGQHRVVNVATSADGAGIQVIDIDDQVTQQLLGERELRLFSESMDTAQVGSRVVGPGDQLEVSIWEAAPATLFGASSATGTSGVIATSRPTTLPDQPVDDAGTIVVPFAGHVPASGKTLHQIEDDITQRLKAKANQPEVLVRMTKNFSSNATVVGEVNLSTRFPLVPGNERLLDALAAAGGVKQPIDKMTIQITRGESVYSLPMETIVRDPKQNVLLTPGDVVAALFQPYSFTALGATGKNDEIKFETQGISVAQALARAGGLVDTRSNPKGVFIFRFEPKDALAWPHKPVKTTAKNLVPTVFRIDLTNPNSFFVMQNFSIEDKDVVYVSNAPVTEIQKFLNVLLTVAYPIIAIQQVN